MKKITLMSICCLLFTWRLPLAHGAEIQLGGTIRESSLYEVIVRDLRPGDVILFDSKRFVLGERLGEGAATLVFAISDSEAIRLPKNRGYRHLICETIEGFRKMQGSHLHVVKVNLFKSSEICDYAIVERVVIRFTMADWFRRQSAQMTLFGWTPRHSSLHQVNLQTHEFLLAALTDFLLSTFEFASLSADFAAVQVGWTGTQWILLDWMKDVRRAYSPDSPTVLSRIEMHGRVLGKSYFEEVDRRIRERRQLQLDCTSQLTIF